MRHNESQIQQTCVRWFRLAHRTLSLLLISIPNGYKTSATQARIAKAEGLVAGASDLFLFVPNGLYHGLAIEMKSETGRQRPSQRLWQEAVEAEGYKYIVCRSLDDFRNEIDNYLNNHPNENTTTT